MTAEPEDLTAAEACRMFARAVGRAEHEGVTTYVTAHGRQVAAIVPVEAAEALERLEDEALSSLGRKALDEPGEPVWFGSFESGRTDLGRHHDDLLADGFDRS